MARLSEKDLAAYTRRTGLKPKPTEADTPAPTGGGFFVVIPGEPVSLNNAYFTAGRQRVLSKDGKDLKRRVADEVWRAGLRPPAGRLSLSLRFYGHWDNKDGTPKKKDLGNMEKIVSDGLFEALSIDDKWVRRISLEAHHDPQNPRIEVTLEEMK